ncbi:MAG: hypothetical protein R3B09_10925 [Nannocystaceae bacterium]
MLARTTLRLAVGLALVSLPATARADIPPDPDSANAHCTQAEQCPNGVFCEYAWDPGQPDDAPDPGLSCRIQVESKGYEQRCRNGGNYSGQNLYCPPGETGTWKPGQTERPTPVEPTPPSEPTPPASPKVEATTPSAPAGSTAPQGSAAKGCSIAGDGGALGPMIVVLALVRRRRSRLGRWGA